MHSSPNGADCDASECSIRKSAVPGFPISLQPRSMSHCLMEVPYSLKSNNASMGWVPLMPFIVESR